MKPHPYEGPNTWAQHRHVDYLPCVTLQCRRLNVWVHPPTPNSCCSLIPSVMVLGGGAFRKWVVHEGEDFMNGISALILKRHQKTPSTTWRYSKKRIINEDRFLPDSSLPEPWSWTSQPPEPCEISFYCLEAWQSVVLCYSSLPWLRRVAYRKNLRTNIWTLITKYKLILG